MTDPVVTAPPDNSPVVVVPSSPAPPQPVVQGQSPTVVVVGNPTGPTGVVLPGTASLQPVTYNLAGVTSFSHSHLFPYLPSVKLVDSSGVTVGVTVEYPDASHVYIVFPQPFTGQVVLS